MVRNVLHLFRAYFLDTQCSSHAEWAISLGFGRFPQGGRLSGIPGLARRYLSYGSGNYSIAVFLCV
jgi:hypothetical protein